MTSQNSIFTSYGLYIYEHDSLLKQKIYYRENNGVFELVSKSSFEYLNGNIVKWNIHTPNDTIKQMCIRDRSITWSNVPKKQRLNWFTNFD